MRPSLSKIFSYAMTGIMIGAIAGFMLMGGVALAAYASGGFASLSLPLGLGQIAVSANTLPHVLMAGATKALSWGMWGAAIGAGLGVVKSAFSAVTSGVHREMAHEPRYSPRSINAPAREMAHTPEIEAGTKWRDLAAQSQAAQAACKTR